MSPVDHFWHKEALKNFLIKKLYKLIPGTKEYKDVLFKLGILEEDTK